MDQILPGIDASESLRIADELFFQGVEKSRLKNHSTTETPLPQHSKKLTVHSKRQSPRSPNFNRFQGVYFTERSKIA